MLFYRDPHTPLQEMIPETAEPVPLPHGSATVKTETLAGEECPDKTTKTLGPVVNGDDPNRASRKPESSESQPIPEEALMERVERMNLDMKETGEETHGGARRGILRRRDQVRAGKRTLQPQRAAVEEEVEAKVKVVGAVVAAAKKRLRRSLV